MAEEKQQNVEVVRDGESVSVTIKAPSAGAGAKAKAPGEEQ